NGPRRAPGRSPPPARASVWGTTTPTGHWSRASRSMKPCSQPFSRVLTLAFDTATPIATSALVRDGVLLGERASEAKRVLADADELLREAGAAPRDLDRIVVGTGPGSFTGVRLGLAAARALAFALDVPA